VTEEEQVTEEEEEQVTEEEEEQVNEEVTEEQMTGGVTKVFQDTQNILYKLYVDIAAASLQNDEENSSLKTELKDLKSEVEQLKRSLDVVTRDRDDKESKMRNLKSLLG
jgi:uncharacterized protein (DUF3084 family)